MLDDKENWLLKFSGTFTLENIETKKTNPVDAQVLYVPKHEKHVIVIYDFKKKVEPTWMEAIITGIIQQFELEPTTTVAIAVDCKIIDINETQPENTISWGIDFLWVKDGAAIREIKEFS